tara:strand:- start:1192 stop:1383 length:192 start_codon:yes stop_codon:yes gene_type:complete
MCIICVEVQKGKLKLDEAWRNLGEMRSSLEENHVEEIEDMLWNMWIDQQKEDDDWYTSHGHGD